MPLVKKQVADVVHKVVVTTLMGVTAWALYSTNQTY